MYINTSQQMLPRIQWEEASVDFYPNHLQSASSASLHSNMLQVVYLLVHLSSNVVFCQKKYHLSYSFPSYTLYTIVCKRSICSCAGGAHQKNNNRIAVKQMGATAI